VRINFTSKCLSDTDSLSQESPITLLLVALHISSLLSPGLKSTVLL
jgi:hypothetical protein